MTKLKTDAAKPVAGRAALGLVQRPTSDAAYLWAHRIVTAWRKSIASIIETGSLLNEAKDALPHGEWLSMVADHLPFGPRKAQMLMAIAHDERIANAKNISYLPPSWPVLYELTKLDDRTFAAMLAEGSIKPDMTKIVVDNEAWLAKHRKFARIKNLPKKTAKKASTKPAQPATAKPAALSRPQSLGAETAQDLLRFVDRLVERLHAMPSNIAVAPRFALPEDRRKMAELATEAINLLSHIYHGASEGGGL